MSHLNLKLKSGNDETIKKFLAGKLKEYKEVNDNLKGNLEMLSESHTKLQNTNE